MDRPEQELRKQHRDDHRHRQRRTRGRHRRAERRVQILPHEQGRHADADRSEVGVAEPQWLAVFQIASLPRVDRDKLRQRGARHRRRQVAADRQRLPLEHGIGVHHGRPVDVHDRREDHVLGVQARHENGPEPGIRAQRLVWRGAGDHHLTRAMINGVGNELRARAALLEADARQPGEIQEAQQRRRPRRRSTSRRGLACL